MRLLEEISLRNDEKFIRQWQKGKLKYILINSTVYCIAYWIVAILYSVVTGRNISKLIDNLDIFVIGFIIYIIFLFRIWNKNEDKYNSLINNNERESK